MNLEFEEVCFLAVHHRLGGLQFANSPVDDLIWMTLISNDGAACHRKSHTSFYFIKRASGKEAMCQPLLRGMLIAIAAILASTEGQADSRVALVIGNAAYRNDSPLRNPPNDATDVSAALQRLGFAVKTIYNANFDDMRRGLGEFGRQARTAGIAVIFFAGHGMEVGGENWLLPVDAEVRSDLDVQNEAIALRNLMAAVAGARSLGLIILDACRNNPFLARMQRLNTNTTRSVERGLARVEPNYNMREGYSMLVAYAAGEGAVAADGNGRNSPFTEALLKNLENSREIRLLFGAVRDDVRKATKGLQDPAIYVSASGQEIYLKPPLRPSIDSIDERAWSQIEITDRVALHKFISRYPTSARVKDAERLLAALSAQKEPAKLEQIPTEKAYPPSLRLKLKADGSKRFRLSEIGDYEGSLPSQNECAQLGKHFGEQLRREAGEGARFWVLIAQRDIGYCQRVNNRWFVEHYDRSMQDALVLDLAR